MATRTTQDQQNALPPCPACQSSVVPLSSATSCRGCVVCRQRLMMVMVDGSNMMFTSPKDQTWYECTALGMGSTRRHAVCSECLERYKDHTKYGMITKDGSTAAMCPQCCYGPLDVHNNCGDLQAHHLQRVRKCYSVSNKANYVGWVVNSCPQCSFYNRSPHKWIPWDRVERSSSVDVRHTLVHVGFESGGEEPHQYLLEYQFITAQEGEGCRRTLCVSENDVELLRTKLLSARSYQYAVVYEKKKSRCDVGDDAHDAGGNINPPKPLYLLLRYAATLSSNDDGTDDVVHTSTIALPIHGTQWIQWETHNTPTQPPQSGMMMMMVSVDCRTGNETTTFVDVNDFSVSEYKYVEGTMIFGYFKVMMPFIDNSEAWDEPSGRGCTDLTMQGDGFHYNKDKHVRSVVLPPGSGITAGRMVSHGGLNRDPSMSTLHSNTFDTWSHRILTHMNRSLDFLNRPLEDIEFVPFQ
eukprot:PhF_6_TR10584/c0_g2_i11/m.16932